MAISARSVLDSEQPDSSPTPKKSWRIVSCINSMEPSGGSELNAVRTAELLRKRGHEVICVSFSDAKDGMYRRYQNADIPVHSFPVDSLIGRAAYRQVRRMARFFREYNVSIVHTHDSYTNFLMTLAARSAGVPSLASKRYTRQYRPQHRVTDWISFRSATHVLANSDAVKQSVLDVEGVAARSVTVIPNFVDDAVFASDLNSQQLRGEFGIPRKAIVFAIVAQLRPEKNHILLLRSFSKLLGHSNPVHLVIVGSGEEQHTIRRAIAELALTEHVTMTGHLQDAWRAYAAADVAVLPSQHEGFPNSVVEAMAMQVPVVASNVGGIPDAVINEDTGLLVPPGDLDALANAMKRMVDDESFRRSAGDRSKIVAFNRFGATAVLDKLEKLYGDILERAN